VEDCFLEDWPLKLQYNKTKKTKTKPYQNKTKYLTKQEILKNNY
jgi:hypothetical protein